MPKITIVDDQQSIRDTVSFALVREGYEVECFENGREAWENLQTRKLPDLIILDIMMPQMDGLELCRKIRGHNENIMIIFLSSKDEEFDRILGLEMGGDDYLCKPFSLKELLTRVKVLLRRQSKESQSALASTSPQKSLQFHQSKYQALWKGELLPLSISEYRILYDLAAHPGDVKTREQLIIAAFPEDNYVSDRSIDSHIKRIRKKICKLDPNFQGIETIYALGYRFKEVPWEN